MINVNLKGEVKQFEAGITLAELTKSISMGLYRNATSAMVNGEVKDLRDALTEDCEVEILTFDSEKGKHAYWHTASHILAQAVQHLFPGTKFGIGPALENGFYYDMKYTRAFGPDDFAAIEAEMKKIIKADLPLEKKHISLEEGRALFADQPYKLELLEEYAEKGWDLTVYTQGDFTDLCAGPHLMSTGGMKGVKLTQATAAYWRGDAGNDSLTRVYGITFPKASQMEEYFKKLEELRSRDHNKIGRELEYFTTVETVGQGLPIILPNGSRVIQLLQRWIEDTEQDHGYLLTKTPMMAKREFYKISGHWDHYIEGMFILGDPYDEEKECFALRPMTCPFQYQVYLNRKRSYRDLPMRLGETSTLFRNEDSGEMHGLTRVRQFTISAGHLVVRPDQLEEEFRDCFELTRYTLGTLGLLDDVTYRFSQWDPANPGNKYEGTAEQWEEAQRVMGNILDNLGVDYKVGIDEAAFYGPKLDIQLKNVYGKEDTLITIQIDMLLAKRFGMYYTGEDGQDHLPYIIHRTSVGCYERTLAALIEKYAGALPTWLMPNQVVVVPITERTHDYANQVAAKLKAAGVRCTVDARSEKMQYKLREAKLKKTPYILVVGDKEAEAGAVAVNARTEAKGGVKSLDEFMSQLLTEIATKARD
ncbi:MAG: threonine--tRNA ligase [Faecalibacterium sp.]|nr:threonine--tRNA ligase [Faecalibacterium sp.]